MGVEIERKFLLCDHTWRPSHAQTIHIDQGYLSDDPTVRIRTEKYESNKFSGQITIKGRPVNITRPEFEYEIPYKDAVFMLEHMCEHRLTKERLVFFDTDRTWYLDIFEGMNKGLVVAEVELSNETDYVIVPDWIGTEITHDTRYLNVNLAKNPYTIW